MVENGGISGSKKVKSGRFMVDFTVKILWRHGGERGYAQIPHPIPHSSTQFHTHQHSFTLVYTLLPCPENSSVIPLCRPKMGDPYSGVLLYTVLYGKIPRPLQRGICVVCTCVLSYRCRCSMCIHYTVDRGLGQSSVCRCCFTTTCVCVHYPSQSLRI